jgi:hypothetical protein
MRTVRVRVVLKRSPFGDATRRGSGEINLSAIAALYRYGLSYEQPERRWRWIGSGHLHAPDEDMGRILINAAELQHREPQKTCGRTQSTSEGPAENDFQFLGITRYAL